MSPPIAHENGIPLVIDNTLASPYLCRPLEHGADIVVHSATKFIGGHGTSIGGIIVDGGKFDYVASGRFPGFTEPDPSYHGLVFSQLPEALRPAQYILKCRLQYQRDVGPALSPFNEFLFLQGLETLSLRMERHSENALAIAQWLEARDEVEWVRYPGLASSPWNARARRSTCRTASVRSSRSGSTVGVEAGQKFVDGLELHSHLANVGDVRSLAIHPATTTHSQLEAEEQIDHGRHRRPRAPVRGHREPARHPGRPGSGLPRRQGVTPAGDRDPPVTGAWRSGTSRAAAVRHLRHPLPLEAGGSLPSVTVAYETWGTLAPDASNAVLVLHALTMDSHAAGPAGAGSRAARLVGRRDRPRRSARHRPLVRGVPERARRLPGHDRPGVGRARRQPYGSRFPASRSATRLRWKPRSPTSSASPAGTRSSAVRWAACACSSGRSDTRERVARDRRVGRRRRHRGADRAVHVQIRALKADPNLRGGDYYDADPGDGPHAGSIARGIGQISYRSEIELDERFGREPQGDEDPLAGGRYAVESYLEYHGEQLVRRFDANTYIVLSEAMNHHDVGRDRGGIARRCRR